MRLTNWGYAIALQSTPHGGPVPCAVGLPGVAKTAWHMALAEMTGRRFIQMILRQLMPEDIKGVPVPDNDEELGRLVRYLRSIDLIRAERLPSIVLLDELNHAGHDVMGAAQEWINNPPEAAWVGAAMNPIESSTAGVELAPPVVNRMCVLKWERPVDERRAGWKAGFRKYPAPRMPVLSEDFLDTCGVLWGETMCEFEDDNLELFGDEAYPKDVNKACDPWPSDRSWTHVGILMAACDSVGAGANVRAELVKGCVGDGACVQFMRWMERRELPDYEALLGDPQSLKLPPRYDISRAILTGVIGKVQFDPTPERWEAGCDVLEVAASQQMEHAASVFGKLWKSKPQGYVPRDRNGAFAEMTKLFVG